MTTLAYNLHRNAFGIKDKAGNTFPDILSSFLELRRINESDLSDGEILESSDRGKSYRLLTDQKVIDRIRTSGEAPCIISFQLRTDLNTGEIFFYAIARLFKTERSK